ncbi:virulence factor [Paraglaciecola aquimarina]|uniref:Virulence factor n=1 Tax=Paraglaciecola algarum TaxID=3050085 RepID=A0ABS9D725_9ALTE|nr:virulence factor [Paraglaciecola sp. G1-23]MCF2947471.1 virulence factor [Paraglaciecola sp. G1-23]
MKDKRFPLPKRFGAAMSEKAYSKLRSLNSKYGYGNNYLLTILLESLDEIADPEALEKAFRKFEAQYGAPKPAKMSGKS